MVNGAKTLASQLLFRRKKNGPPWWVAWDAATAWDAASGPLPTSREPAPEFRFNDDGAGEYAAQVYFLRGHCMEMMDQKAGAVFCYRRALELDPACTEAFDRLTDGHLLDWCVRLRCAVHQFATVPVHNPMWLPYQQQIYCHFSTMQCSVWGYSLIFVLHYGVYIIPLHFPFTEDPPLVFIPEPAFFLFPPNVSACICVP